MATADYGPYVASLKRDADGIFEVVTGAASIRFIKTMRVQRTDEQMEGHDSRNRHGRVPSSGPGG